MSETEQAIRLTQYSHGAGCGCKISPQVLSQILKGADQFPHNPLLVAGNEGNEDAAVYDLGDGKALISTTDFFMPVVDDPFEFGSIAAANAISDVYAMGGTPKLALAILGWPISKLSPEVAQEVMRGGREKCREAGISIAGGHSIDTPEPLFGLSVNGIIELEHLKRNKGARDGDLIFITKSIGFGLMTTALKRGLLKPEHKAGLIEQLCRLNKIGETLGKIAEVTSMTDVTGFGLMGHCLEMAEGSGLTAEIDYAKIPLMEGVKTYVPLNAYPDATFRNWNAYSAKTNLGQGLDPNEAFALLPDPQTNGGLLFTVDPRAERKIADLLESEGLGAYKQAIGHMKKQENKSLSLL